MNFAFFTADGNKRSSARSRQDPGIQWRAEVTTSSTQAVYFGLYYMM